MWLDPLPRPGWQNMALDQALLDLAAREHLAVLRIYRWDPCCLSFGRHEPARRRYGRERVERRGLDAVRRPTGGRAVWHAEELTYAVAAPLGTDSLAVTYHHIHLRLLQAVRALGAGAAALATRPARVPGPGDGGCFGVAVGGEVVVDGRKLLGSAQVRQDGAFLQHGSLLLDGDQGVVRALLDQPGDQPPETSLRSVLGRRVSFDEAADAVVAEFGTETCRAPALPHLEAAAALHAERFRSTAWTWER